MKKDLPQTYKEKESLREMIRSGLLKNEDGVPESEENFEEAIRAVNSVVLPSTVPSRVKQILDDDSCVNLTSKVGDFERKAIEEKPCKKYLIKFQSKPFWILAKAVRDFVENEGEGCLPLRGTLPDMTAETTGYITLQQM